MEVLSKMALAFASPRLFSPEREISGGSERNGAIIRKKKVEIIDPKLLNKHFGRFKRQIYIACRNYGSRLDALGMWAVPLADDRATKLEQELTRIAAEWETERGIFTAAYPDYVAKQVAANPEDASIIQSLAPSSAEVSAMIRLSWGVLKVDSDNILAHAGLDKEIDSLPMQAAHEISLEIKERINNCAGKYTRASVNVLMEVAKKAESFGFLSPALAAVRPAVERLFKSLPPGASTFDGVDALTIGALVGFLSDPTRLIAEGRRIEDSVFVPPPQPALDLDLSVAPPQQVQVPSAASPDASVVSDPPPPSDEAWW